MNFHLLFFGTGFFREKSFFFICEKSIPYLCNSENSFNFTAEYLFLVTNSGELGR